MTKNKLYSPIKKLVLQFCSISTVSHLHKTYALAYSLAKYNAVLHVLVVDGAEANHFPTNVRLYGLEVFDKQPLAQQIITKYKHQPDKLRWALKPLFMMQVLTNQPKVIYVDNDIYFYSNPSFLFDKLNESNVLLTPHFYPSNPASNQNWLEANYRVGLYNAGFLGANQNAQEALIWWANCCLYNLKKAYWRGLFDDQKYLDLLPIKFDSVQVLKHAGCNFAGWNDDVVDLHRESNGELLINQKYPLVFVHFAALSIQKFSQSTHKLYPEYQEYLKNIRKYKADYQDNTPRFSRYAVSAYLHYTKWRLARIFEN
jgi:hypothetical protein